MGARVGVAVGLSDCHVMYISHSTAQCPQNRVNSLSFQHLCCTQQEDETHSSKKIREQEHAVGITAQLHGKMSYVLRVENGA